MIQEALQAKPVTTVAKLRGATGLTTPTIHYLLSAIAFFDTREFDEFWQRAKPK
jgi:hypothetical protein